MTHNCTSLKIIPTMLYIDLRAVSPRIKYWITANFLCLNAEKTEVLLVEISSQLSKLSSITTNNGKYTQLLLVTARNLGGTSSLSMNKCVNENCTSAVYNMKCISRIGRFLTKKPLKHLSMLI